MLGTFYKAEKPHFWMFPNIVLTLTKIYYIFPTKAETYLVKSFSIFCWKLGQFKIGNQVFIFIAIYVNNRVWIIKLETFATSTPPGLEPVGRFIPPPPVRSLLSVQRMNTHWSWMSVRLASPGAILTVGGRIGPRPTLHYPIIHFMYWAPKNTWTITAEAELAA